MNKFQIGKKKCVHACMHACERDRGLNTVMQTTDLMVFKLLMCTLSVV